ncbi:MAG TPA: MFS transporter [Candidatus Acidoferrales bacterium]|nr:MFS transporter [Candidatus Acidoferrales bacterium]
MSIRASLITLSLGWVLIYADRLSISPLMILIRQQFNLSFFSVSLLLSIYFLAYVAFTIPAAIISEKFGYKRTMVAFLFLAAISFAFVGVFGSSYYFLLVFLGLHGVGAGAYYPTAFKISTTISPPEKRGLSSAIINCGMGLGTIIGLTIAGPTLLLFKSWQAVFLLLSAPTALTALLLERTIVYKDVRATSNFRLSTFKELFQNKNFIYMCLAMFCSLYGYWVILSWAPSFLQTTRHLNVFYSGLATGIFAAVAIPSSVLIARYSDRIGRKKISLLILPLASLSILLMAFTQNLLVFMIAIVVYGIVGKLTLDPLVVAWTGEVVSSTSLGLALALLNVFAMGSSILAPVITGVLADASGTLSYGFYAGSVVVIIGTGFLALVTRDRPRTRL